MTALLVGLTLMLISLTMNGIRIHRMAYTQLGPKLLPESSFPFLPPELTRLDAWERELSTQGFVRVGDYSLRIERPEGQPPPRRPVFRVWQSNDRRTLAVAQLTIVDLSGKGDEGGQIRPLFLHLISSLGPGVLRTHNTISRGVGAPPEADVDQRMPEVADAMPLWRAHDARLAMAGLAIDDPRAFLEALHARTLAAHVAQGALVVDSSGLARPRPLASIALMAWNNLPFSGEARSALRGAALTACLCAVSAVYAVSLARLPGEQLGTAQLAMYPLLAVVVAALYPNTFPNAVVLVLLCASPLWRAHPVETNLWLGGAVLIGLSCGLLLINLRRRGVRASAATPTWFAAARVMLIAGGAVNGAIVYVMLQVPTEQPALIALHHVAERWSTVALLLACTGTLAATLISAFMRPSVAVQLGQLVAGSIVAVGLGARLGVARTWEDTLATARTGRAVHEVLRARHAATGELPDRLDGLGVTTRTAMLFPAELRYSVVGPPADGNFELWYPSPYGGAYWWGYAFLPRKGTASVVDRRPSRPSRVPTAAPSGSARAE